MPTRAIDSHVHFWKVSENDWYPALKPFAEAVGSDTLNTDFSPADYHRSAEGVDVHAFVHVSAATAPRAYLDESLWVDALAREQDLDLVMIGTIDPESSPDVITADLDTQAELARFRGARVFPGIAPDAPAAGALLDWLDSHGMIFDLVTDPGNAGAWAERLRQYPDLRVALEHTGSPSPADADGMSTWLAGMRELAARPTTSCKITGLGMATMDLGEPTLRPWIEGAIETFGWDRVMFGSNVPIETMAGPYSEWIDTLEIVLNGASDSERERFYQSNARGLYW